MKASVVADARFERDVNNVTVLSEVDQYRLVAFKMAIDHRAQSALAQGDAAAAQFSLALALLNRDDDPPVARMAPKAAPRPVLGMLNVLRHLDASIQFPQRTCRQITLGSELW